MRKSTRIHKPRLVRLGSADKTFVSYSILYKLVAANRDAGPPLLLGRRGERGEEAHCRPGHTIL